jgi:hypothetical protein
MLGVPKPQASVSTLPALLSGQSQHPRVLAQAVHVSKDKGLNITVAPMVDYIEINVQTISSKDSATALE